MIPLISVIVYWCVSSAPVDSFNPHQLDAVKKFVQDNPATCHVSFEDTLYVPNLTVEQCRRQSILYFMTGWLEKSSNSGKLYLGADCVEESPSKPLDLNALKERMTP